MRSHAELVVSEVDSLKAIDASVRLMTTMFMYGHTSADKRSHPWLGLWPDNEIWDHQLPLLSWLSSSPSSSLFLFFIFSSLFPNCCIAFISVKLSLFFFLSLNAYVFSASSGPMFLPSRRLSLAFSVFSVLPQFSFPCTPIFPAPSPPSAHGRFLPSPWPA